MSVAESLPPPDAAVADIISGNDKVTVMMPRVPPMRVGGGDAGERKRHNRERPNSVIPCRPCHFGKAP
jgi:hypothetical protein